MEFGIGDEKVLKELNDWDGIINYLNDYRQQNEVSGDAAYWIDRVLQATNDARTEGSAFLEQYQGAVEFTKSLTDRIDAAKDDRRALQEPGLQRQHPGVHDVRRPAHSCLINRFDVSS